MAPLNLAPVGTDLGGALVIVAALALLLATFAVANYAGGCIRRYKALKQRGSGRPNVVDLTASQG